MAQVAAPDRPAQAANLRLGRLRHATWRGERIDWSAYVFVAPFFVPFLILTLGAILFVSYVSFTDWGIVGDPHWVGFENYVQALNDPWIPKVWGNTLHYGLVVAPLTTLVALGFALLVNQRWPGRTVARTVFYAPNVVSVTVIGLVWVWMLDTQFGLVNQYLGVFGVRNIPWLTNPDWALYGVGIASVWWDAGFAMVVFLAGLQDIPLELREAAMIDGAGRMRVFWHVVLPLLRPALTLVVTLQVISTLRVFSQIYIMTNGGPAGATASVIQYVYQIGFSKYQLGYAASISLMLFATILVITFVELRLFRERTW